MANEPAQRLRGDEGFRPRQFVLPGPQLASDVSFGGDYVQNWVIGITAILFTGALSVSQGQPTGQSSRCRAVGELVRVPELSEASGVAASRRNPGIFWAHNDSGDPALFALDGRGAVKGRVRVTGAAVDDWEDIAVGPCAQDSCVYIADIGDNDGERKQITIYRTPEPATSDAATPRVETFTASYPDGPHDAESLLVTRDEGVFVVTKGEPGAIALFRFPPPLTPGKTAQLQRVGAPLADGKVEARDRPTAADVSPDGDWVVVRTTAWVAFYPFQEFMAGRWREAFRADLRFLDEPRGEGVTFAGDDGLVLVGEAGGLLRGPGTFARVSCGFPPR